MSEDLDSLASILALRAEVKAHGEDADLCHAMAKNLEAIGELGAAAGWYVRASRAAAGPDAGGDTSLQVWFAEQAVRVAPENSHARAQLISACAGNGAELSATLREANEAHDASPLEEAISTDGAQAAAHAALASYWLGKGDREKAAAWFLKAATHAERHLNLRAAIAHIRKAAELSDSLGVQRELQRLTWIAGKPSG